MIRDEFKVLGTLQDMNTDLSTEVQTAIKEGKFETMDSKELIKKANKCFMELNFLSAAAIFERGFSKFQEDAKFLFSFGYFLYECQFLKLSEQLLRKSIELNPELDPRVYFCLAEMYVNQESLEMYMKGLKLSEAQGTNLEGQINQTSVQENTPQGQENSQKIQKIQTKLQNTKRTVAQAYCAVAELLMKHPDFPNNTNDIDQAIQKAEEHDPTYYEFLCQKAIYFFNIVDEAKCREVISLFVSKIKQLDLENDTSILDYPSNLLVTMVRMMIEGGIYEDGVYLCKIACNNDATNGEAFYMHAFCCLCLKDFKACRDSLQKLSTIDLSSDEELSFGLGELVFEYEAGTKKKLHLTFKLHPSVGGNGSGNGQ